MSRLQKLLKRMSLDSNKKNESEIDVIIPPMRQDILHACDIMEDVAIAYGYNNIELFLPESLTISGQLMLNKISDQLRNEIARCGFTEVLTFSLVCLII